MFPFRCGTMKSRHKNIFLTGSSLQPCTAHAVVLSQEFSFISHTMVFSPSNNSFAVGSIRNAGRRNPKCPLSRSSTANAYFTPIDPYTQSCNVPELRSETRNMKQLYQVICLLRNKQYLYLSLLAQGIAENKTSLGSLKKNKGQHPELGLPQTMVRILATVKLEGNNSLVHRLSHGTGARKRR